MSEEKVQETVQENLDIKVENKPEAADSGLLQEVMAKKATIKERDARIAELEAADEKRRHKELSDEGKKDELITELNAKYEKIETEYTRLSKFEETEKLRLIDSITSDKDEKNELKNIDQTQQWVKIGKRVVNLKADHDEIPVTANAGVFTKLKFNTNKHFFNVCNFLVYIVS